MIGTYVEEPGLSGGRLDEIDTVLLLIVAGKFVFLDFPRVIITDVGEIK